MCGVWYAKQLWIAKDGNYRQIITMTYSHLKLSFDHFYYMCGATSFYPRPVRERKRKREEKVLPKCICKNFCLVHGETVQTQEDGQIIESYFIKT